MISNVAQIYVAQIYITRTSSISLYVSHLTHISVMHPCVTHLTCISHMYLVPEFHVSQP